MSRSSRPSPNVTPFIPPLASPQPSPNPPVVPSPNTSGTSLPTWGMTPQHPGNYPAYPSTPYTTAPYIPFATPGMTTSMMPGGFLAPPMGAIPQQAGGVSMDWTGYPQFVHPTPVPMPPAQFHPGTPWQAHPAAPLPPSHGPWGLPRQGYPPFQQPLPNGGLFPGGGPWPLHMTPGHMMMNAADPWGLHTPGPAWNLQHSLPDPTAPHGPLGRASTHVGDRVDPFAAGNHYGPVLDPFLIRVVGAQIKLNPLVQPLPDDGSDRPHLKWDMLFPSNTCQRSTDPGHVSWSNGRQEPVTFPRVSSLRIVSENFRWTIEVHAKNRDAGVTCGELIDTLSDSFNKLTTERDYGSLPTQKKQSVGQAYRRNRSRAQGVPGGRLGDGMRRLDFLDKDTMFGGIEVNEQLVKSICGDLLPCTFVLKCVRRYQMTPQEIRDHEARQGAASQTSRAGSDRHRATVTGDDDGDE